MYEVVYNSNYGGYGISKKALEILWEMSPDDSIWNTSNFEIDGNYVYMSSEIENKSRTDKYLITAIKKYGSDVMSGDCASLEVYDSVSRAIRIKSFDGRESVEEIDMGDVIIID